MRILLSGILLFALCSPAFAQDAGVVAQNFAWLGDNMRSLSHTLMTIGGVGSPSDWRRRRSAGGR